MLNLLLANQKIVYDKGGTVSIENSDSSYQKSNSLESTFFLHSNSLFKSNVYVITMGNVIINNACPFKANQKGPKTIWVYKTTSRTFSSFTSRSTNKGRRYLDSGCSNT